MIRFVSLKYSLGFRIDKKILKSNSIIMKDDLGAWMRGVEVKGFCNVYAWNQRDLIKDGM